MQRSGVKRNLQDSSAPAGNRRASRSLNMGRQWFLNPAVPMKWLMHLGLVVCAAMPLRGAESVAVAPGVQLVGRLQSAAITESSGLTASWRQTNVFWTHNDGGGKRQVLFAINRSGQLLGQWRVTGAALEDWEDIGIDDRGHLFLADIGNNDAKRTTLAVYQVAEPDVTGSTASLVRVARQWTLQFPAQPFDCEAFFVWRDYGYVISKEFKDARADVYRFSLSATDKPVTLERVAELKIDSPVTGAAISRDGKTVGVVAKNGGYAFRVHGDPANIGRVKALRAKFRHDHVEACTFVPDGMLATAESREIFLFTGDGFLPGVTPD
jgi:hypothetical protein